MTEHDDDPIARADHLRSSPGGGARVTGFKEWMYFYVSTPDLDLLCTFTLLDRYDRRPTDAAPASRVVALVRTSDGRWQGGVDEIAPHAVSAAAGRVSLAMGPSSMRFSAGAYAVVLRLASSALEAHLRFRPVVMPAVGDSVRLGDGGPMRWIVVPRLVAHGEVTIAGRRYEIADAPAYHDHNWGTFSWGGDFAWEWALVLAGTPGVSWSAVYSRISDRARTSVLSQELLLWRDASYCRAFRGDELTVTETSLLRGGARLRVPPVMSLVEPGTTADVPHTLVAHAAGGGDHLDLRLTTLDFAEIAVPNEGLDLGTTLLCEVRAEAELTGTVRGESLATRGPAVLELNHDASSQRPAPPRRLLRAVR